MLNNIKHSVSGNSFQISNDTMSGLRSNVFKVEFIDNSFNVLSTSINIIKGTIINKPGNNDEIPYGITDVSSLSNFVKTVNGIPDRVQPDAQEYRTPFISYRFQANRQSFDTFSISFIEPFGLPIKKIFRYLILKYIINPRYNVIQEQKNYKFAIRVIHYSNIIDSKSLTNLSERNNPLQATKVYTFYGVFPVTINGLQLQYDSVEPVQTDITFQYDYWDVNDQIGVTADTIKSGI